MTPTVLSEVFLVFGRVGVVEDEEFGGPVYLWMRTSPLEAEKIWLEQRLEQVNHRLQEQHQE